MTLDDLMYRPGIASALCLKSIDRELTVISREIGNVKAKSAALALEAQVLLNRAHSLNALRFEDQCALPGCVCLSANEAHHE